ncbi:MAG TPA: alpha/beta family hydrolase [Candidatus Dormibacteraeota bacterium]|nr:alpha/beta family hydrolase [Candidatus Dormibacteraeota bacterium]
MESLGIESLEFEYRNSSSKSGAYLLLHGIRGGIHEAYTQALFNKLQSRDDTVLALNFPYMSRGEERSGMNTNEEMYALQTAYDFLKSAGKTPIHIIGKSFGGIVTSHWLSQNRDAEDVDVSIMGYVPGEGNILPDALRGKLRVVVQGEHDRYASPAQIRVELTAHEIEADVIEIANADHSYRDNGGNNQQEYAYQDRAIDELLKRI